MAKEEIGSATAPPSTEPSKGLESDIKSGIAAELWLELLPLPGYSGGAQRLWLLVDDNWRYLDKPWGPLQESVESAFCSCPDSLEVVVWYRDYLIVGLVVRSKYDSTSG